MKDKINTWRKIESEILWAMKENETLKIEVNASREIGLTFFDL
jgi:hypothetical protein